MKFEEWYKKACANRPITGKDINSLIPDDIKEACNKAWNAGCAEGMAAGKILFDQPTPAEPKTVTELRKIIREALAKILYEEYKNTIAGFK